MHCEDAEKKQTKIVHMSSTKEKQQRKKRLVESHGAVVLIVMWARMNNRYRCLDSYTQKEGTKKYNEIIDDYRENMFKYDVDLWEDILVLDRFLEEDTWGFGVFRRFRWENASNGIVEDLDDATNEMRASMGRQSNEPVWDLSGSMRNIRRIWTPESFYTDVVLVRVWLVADSVSGVDRRTLDPRVDRSLFLQWQMRSCRSTMNSILPHRMTGVSGQWCRISGIHLFVMFVYEVGLMTLKQSTNTSVCG